MCFNLILKHKLYVLLLELISHTLVNQLKETHFIVVHIIQNIVQFLIRYVVFTR